MCQAEHCPGKRCVKLSTVQESAEPVKHRFPCGFYQVSYSYISSLHKVYSMVDFMQVIEEALMETSCSGKCTGKTFNDLVELLSILQPV